MPLSTQDIQNAAAQLWSARASQTPCAPLTELYPGLSLLDAYTISDINLRRKLELPGIKLEGKKIGLTSRAVQKQLGVDQPDFGYLTNDMNAPNGGEIKISSLIQPRVEGELAFMLKKDLVGPGITNAHVISATEFVVPCIEIIDSRIKDWKIKVEDTVADNASSGMFVLGSTPKNIGFQDWSMAGMALRINGEVESTGVGRACLDHPVNAVAWLANALGAYGVSLKAGEVILAGAFGPVVPVRAGDVCEVEMHGLGPVSCRFI